MPHFHMPLQSGSNEILKKMRRRYLRELYTERVETIKSKMPHACIGADVITGFPSESEEHFMETYHFLQELNIDYIHAFTYSEREDTLAASMPDSVPMTVRRERSQMLRNLSMKKKLAHFTRHLGETREVLIEKGPAENMISGFTDNYIRILMPYTPGLVNTIQPIVLNELTSFHDEVFTKGFLLPPS
jgi:threonylcarbamoyladenosine tRNA methylthiotransferase MtaB